MNPPSRVPEEFFEFPRKRCCRRGLPLGLLGLLTAALWAGLLTLLLLWHWDTMRNVRQLEVAAAQNVSRISKELQSHLSEQLAQKYQAALMSQAVQELQAGQKKQKEPQDSELSQNLDRLWEDLSSIKSQNLNERHMALESLERLKEELAKLRVQIQVSKGSVCNACPEQWVSFQQKCYYFGEEPKQWLQARYSCEDLGGRLVSIHSQEQQDFLTKLAKKEGTWIGLRDLDIEGQFLWMDGSSVDYSNWQPGEPNNADPGEDCVMLLRSGKWNDAFCRDELDAWVCEQLATCGPSFPADPTDDSLDSDSLYSGST
ncbi:low affinity immunoglobulin epsilon Fc receptor isoform X2 [Octodon degus]|uniref:low affinity immunoglobulin epsilon Fc receptor isoform X2 n=1 Tax=Octodon degus TaxID=10160 RepID=UPI000C9F3C0B|nr:low affinity immunoglobulin epsilon Fc receptor isoform X2 [Octodon degus]